MPRCASIKQPAQIIPTVQRCSHRVGRPQSQLRPSRTAAYAPSWGRHVSRRARWSHGVRGKVPNYSSSSFPLEARYYNWHSSEKVPAGRMPSYPRPELAAPPWSRGLWHWPHRYLSGPLRALVSTVQPEPPPHASPDSASSE